MSTYPDDLRAQLRRGGRAIQELATVMVPKQPHGDGQRAVECMKAAALLYVFGELVDQMAQQLVGAMDIELHALSTGEIMAAKEPLRTALKPAIDGFRGAAEQDGMAGFEFACQRLRDQLSDEDFR